MYLYIMVFIRSMTISIIGKFLYFKGMDYFPVHLEFFVLVSLFSSFGTISFLPLLFTMQKVDSIPFQI